MKYIEKEKTITITDYPIAILILGVMCGSLAFYVLSKGDIPNFIMILLLALIFSLVGKKRKFVVDKNKGSFQFEEKNMLGRTILSSVLGDIKSVTVQYGRGRTIIPSGFVVIKLYNGKKIRLNEYGRLFFGKNNNQYIVNKITVTCTRTAKIAARSSLCF